ncbi:kinase-like domain-containing protein [Amylocystis lapponica]|nr:kinase-like domain-containing protein [Amylocystis lapponica]
MPSRCSMDHGSASIPNLVGHTIDHGRLKLIDTIGSGSNGVVFLAIDTTSQAEHPAKYAVKCLIRAPKGTRRHGLQRQEVLLHRRVSSQPNIVQLHMVLEDIYYTFLVLDYCPGGDLYTFLAEQRIVRGNDVLVKTIFLQIVDAVEACHNWGIFHRDVKPENILCSGDWTRVYLSDFGLATEATRSVTYGCGSSYYMSPECVGACTNSKGYDTCANDIWALGVILTSMISGHNPWRSASPADPCYTAYLHDPNFLYNMLPISASANALLQHIFTPDPAQRITLAHLRLLVLDVPTFFRSAAQIARSSDRIKKAAAVYYADGRQGRIQPRLSPVSSSDHDVSPGLLADCDAYIISVHERLARASLEISYTSGTDICRVPRTQPTNSESVESHGPLTPDPEKDFHAFADAREEGGAERKEFLRPAVARVVTSGRRARALSTGFIRRIVGLAPVS